MRKALVIFLALLLFHVSFPALAQQVQLPVPAAPANPTDEQIQNALAERNDKQAIFNRLMFERMTFLRDEARRQGAQALTEANQWWADCVQKPECVEWVNTAKVARIAIPTRPPIPKP